MTCKTAQHTIRLAWRGLYFMLNALKEGEDMKQDTRRYPLRKAWSLIVAALLLAVSGVPGEEENT